jgi:hypothetical protein
MGTCGVFIHLIVAVFSHDFYHPSKPFKSFCWSLFDTPAGSRITKDNFLTYLGFPNEKKPLSGRA